MHADAGQPVAFEDRIRARRRRRLAWAVALSPAAFLLAAGLHAAVFCAAGWTPLLNPTRETLVLYVDLTPQGEVVLTDPFAGSLVPFNVVDDPMVDRSRTLLILRYEAQAQTPRLAPHRLDLARAVYRFVSEPPPERTTILHDGPPRKLTPDQAEQLRVRLASLLSGRGMMSSLIGRRLPLVYGESATRNACPFAPGLSARFGLFGLLLIPVVAIGDALDASRAHRRIERGRCGWCAHPLEGDLCTECGTRHPDHTATM